ncbi:Spc7-domain-containing protein [Neurospora hispaniola]|uniref:Spc7-domain-containing protein n=1 Tax=Neurospora hispaniola TaxID=588809 RepID=A0AAJ0IBJ9_9PEZI|nr:Spc7-domain-containing protein [Neurospora hispaniola]
MTSQQDVTLPPTRIPRKSLSGGSPTKKRAEKDNATVDIGAMGAGRKKMRSKSMGPGSLDIFKSGNGNRRASLAVPSRPPPRSILKPTSLPEIPTFKSRQAGSQVSGTDQSTSSFDSGEGGTRVAVRTEEEQQAAAREREEKERAQVEKDNNERREARRKSLANRRVSFAAEATLHTFHEIELPQDSTTSTDTTRRASSSTTAPSPAPSTLEASKPLPAPDNAEDDTIAYDSDLEHADSVAEIQAEEMTGSSDDSDVEDGTMMTVEAEELTSASIATPRSHFSADSSGDLDENLRLAARRAVTQRLDEDEEVIAGFAGWGKKNIAQGSSSQGSGQHTRSNLTQVDQVPDTDMDADMDMTTAVGGIIRRMSPSPEGDDGDDMDMSMDVTKAIGGIIAQPIPSTIQEQSARPGARSLEVSTTSRGDRTMELPTAVGGTQHSRVSDVSQFDTDANEDMSMEITTAIGAVLGGTSFGNAPQESRSTTNNGTNDEEDEASMMDMTVSVGQILRDRSENEANDTQAMDITAVVGGIIKPAPTPQQGSTSQAITGPTAKENVRPLTSTAVIRTSPKRRRSAVVDENGSPGLAAFQNNGLRQSLPPASSVAAGGLSNDAPSSPLQSSPLRSSPTRILPTRSSPDRRPLARQPSPGNAPETQLGTPVSKPAPRMIGSRSSSPIRAASPMAKTTPLSLKSKLFRQDPSTGLNTPRIVLTPQNRRLSGVGADRPGLGSPKVAEIIDRRDSIGETAPDFVPSQPDGQRRAVAFADPRVMEAELDKERREEEERENSRRILERETDGERDATVNLMEMIQGLTPKKKPLRGRKSLAVGSARGLLGKRPVELDQDIDEDTPEKDGVKRLKGHQGSPVKNIRLQAPPSKAETTTGRETVSEAVDQTSNNTATPTIPSSPTKTMTPRNQGRFKDVANDQPTITMDFDHTGHIDENAEQRNDDGERIHLQDFLNMTSIRFMELTTTKRRHTIAPGASRDSTSAEDKDVTFESCVVAGACTVPMLELYQHSCRELKKYISEGRRIVRDIETETFVENPPLFKEYISATPELKLLMDNQFKNVKSHARLLSKAMWYEWRMKLQEGLKEGLFKISEGMDKDDELLRKQQELLSSVLPSLTKRFGALERELENLEAVEKELEDCDPEDLEAARAELTELDKTIAEKSKKIEELRQQVEEHQTDVQSLADQKQQYLDDITAADKIREECRGWSLTEISSLKARVDKLEEKSGWAINKIEASVMFMTYKREIELAFDLASFKQQHKQGSTIDIRYIAHKREGNVIPLTPERIFFIECISSHLQALSKSSLSVNRLLTIVSDAWDKADAAAEQIRLLNLSFPTKVTRTSDTTLEVRSSLLLAPLQTRVEVCLALEKIFSNKNNDSLDVRVTSDAKVLYGEQFTKSKLNDFLKNKLGKQVLGKKEQQQARGNKKKQQQHGWSEVVLELYKRLMAKGAKVGHSGQTQLANGSANAQHLQGLQDQGVALK